MFVTPQQTLTLSAVLLSVFFFISGASKCLSVTGVSKGLAQKLPFLGKSLCYLTILGVIVLEIIAPILIVAPKKSNYYPFMRNLAIIGGLLALSLHFR